MTMTITVNDSVADKAMAFLNSLPKESVRVEQSRPWYADEVKTPRGSIPCRRYGDCTA